MQQITQLNHHVTELKTALSHASVQAQKDQVALNKSYEHLEEFRNGHNESELLRAKFENDLNEERQEHRMCQETLSHERISHHEIERNLNCVWNANSRLEELLSEVHYEPKDGSAVESNSSVDVSQLVLDSRPRISI